MLFLCYLILSCAFRMALGENCPLGVWRGTLPFTGDTFGFLPGDCQDVATQRGCTSADRCVFTKSLFWLSPQTCGKQKRTDGMTIGDMSLAMKGLMPSAAGWWQQSCLMLQILPAPNILCKKQLFLQGTSVLSMFWHRVTHKPSAKRGAGGAKWMLLLTSN